MTITRPSWPHLLLLLGAAAVLRALFYTGFFGADEVTYTGSAFRLLDGNWTVSSYVGANRYGVNLPVALAGLVFGRNEFAAAIYSLLCSIAEIGLLAWLGAQLLGARVALIGAWLLALTPMHVHIAGRLMADAPMALAVTASFLLFFIGEQRHSRLAYVLAGLALGWSFWIKPAAVFYGGVFLLVPLLERRWRWDWLWMVAGFAGMLFANCALFAVLTGEWTYLFRVMAERKSSGYLEAELSSGAQMNVPWYYLVYLFGKIWHTGLLGPLALIGFWQLRRAGDGGRRVLIWGLGLIAIMSLLPVSFAPLTWVPKQTNYMTMFLAPLALASGFAVVRLGRFVWLLIVPVSMLLAGFLQAQIALFTANSFAVVSRMRADIATDYWLMTNAYRAASFSGHFGQPLPNAKDLDDWLVGKRGIVVWDRQTERWSPSKAYRTGATLPACLRMIEEIQGKPSGLAAYVLDGAGALTWAAPESLRGSIESIIKPKPAILYLATDC